MRRLKRALKYAFRSSNPHQANFACEEVDGRNGHIIISGTGRAGTTLLVQILTHLGMDTGYDEQQSLSSVDPVSNAGLERKLKAGRRLPKVIQSPWLSDEISTALKDGVEIQHAIIPFRDLHSAAESRRRVSAKARSAGADPHKAPGGLWKTQNPEEQETVLTRQFYALLETLILNDIPTTFLAFPRFTTDLPYFYKKMRPIIGKDVDFEKFSTVCNKIIDQKKISIRAQED